MRTVMTHRLFFVLVTGWMSVCLFIAGFFPGTNELMKNTWLVTGAVGMIACIAASSLLKQESQFNSNLIREYEIQSLTDPLTNLANRRGFDIHLNDLIAKEKKNPAAKKPRAIFLAFLDVDNFKSVNDTNGHPIGDQMLDYIAQTIYSCMPEKGVAARLGGDEFAIIYLDAPPELVVWSIKAIKTTIDQESFERDDLVHTTISVGLTNYHPLDNYNMLVDRADKALYRTKNQGRNKITFS